MSAQFFFVRIFFDDGRAFFGWIKLGNARTKSNLLLSLIKTFAACHFWNNINVGYNGEKLMQRNLPLVEPCSDLLQSLWPLLMRIFYNCSLIFNFSLLFLTQNLVKFSVMCTFFILNILRVKNEFLLKVIERWNERMMMTNELRIKSPSSSFFWLISYRRMKKN